jgi:SAM-dependent methyltransferase
MSDAAFYGDTWAAIYDEVHAHLDPSAAVDALARLAGTGTALELGVGTGRVAIPLAARGVAVHGIEASRAMLDRMRAKPGGADVAVTLGDFTDVAVDGEYTVIYVVFSTLYGLPTQSAQVACVRNAAARLAPGGAFVVEGFVPDPARFDGNQRVQVNRMMPKRSMSSAWRHTWFRGRLAMSSCGGRVRPHIARGTESSRRMEFQLPCSMAVVRTVPATPTRRAWPVGTEASGSPLK